MGLIVSSRSLRNPVSWIKKESDIHEILSLNFLHAAKLIGNDYFPVHIVKNNYFRSHQKFRTNLNKTENDSNIILQRVNLYLMIVM